MTALVDKTCQDTIWLTPESILGPVRAALGGKIWLDPCTERSNPTKAAQYYTVDDDGLAQDWARGVGVFVNPPYGSELMQWVRKICIVARTGTPIIALLPGQRFETTAWQDDLLPCPNLNAIVFIRRRVKFLRPSGEVAKSNPYGSMLYVFNTNNVVPLSVLGHVFKVAR